MLKRLAYLQQQTQRQMVQWHNQQQPDSDYRELETDRKKHYRTHRNPCQTA